jgi:hypothetical protein
VTRERLGPSVSIDVIRDDGLYELPGDFAPHPTNLFFIVGRLGQVFIKTPTERGLHDYRAFIRDGISTDADIRPLEESERFDSYVARPDPQGRDPELVHYLHVHKLQYQRLRNAGVIGVPEARFASISGPDVPTSPRPDVPTPAIFQARIPGSTLWDMFDVEAMAVQRAWQPHKPAIAAQLRVLLESPLVIHVDWNIRNFIFNGAEQRLYYVDSKPTTFVARSSNEQNLIGIRTHWLK